MLLKKVFWGSTWFNQVKQVSVPQDFLQGARVLKCWWVSRKDLKSVSHYHFTNLVTIRPCHWFLGDWVWSMEQEEGIPSPTRYMTSQPLMSVPLLAYLMWQCWRRGGNHSSHPPPYLRSLRVAEFRSCRSPTGVGILRILLICVSVVEGKWRGEIQNSPEKGYGKKLTKDILFSRDKRPGFPSQASLGLESCLLVRDPHRQPYSLIQHRADSVWGFLDVPPLSGQYPFMYCGTTWHTTKQAHPLHTAVRDLSFHAVCLTHMEKIRSFFLMQENFKLQFLFCLKCIYYLSVSLLKMESWLEINILLGQTKGCIWKSWKWAWRGKIHFSFQDPFSVLKRKWTNIYWLLTISQAPG